MRQLTNCTGSYCPLVLIHQITTSVQLEAEMNGLDFGPHVIR